VIVNNDPNLKNKASDALIIGAGAAGLAAARDLSVAGRKVIVLEARDRIGGRIFTYKDPSEPIHIELGAEFVHGKSPELWHIAQKAHLELYEVSERHWYLENGKLTKSDDFWTKIESLIDKMKLLDTDQSFKDFLSSLPDDEETRRAEAMAVRYVEGFHAANIERIGVKGLIKANEAADSIDGDKSFRFLNGYDSLVQVLRAEAEAYGATFCLNTVVKEIRWSGDGVEAVCEGDNGDSSFAAFRAIITLPLGVLQTSPDQAAAVRFIPELPPEKQTAIKNLEMGHVIRIVLSFRERFWETLKIWNQDNNPVKFADAGFINCPDAPLPTWWTQLPLRAPILVGWVGGPNVDRISRGSTSRQDIADRTERGGDRLAQAGGEPFDSFVLDQASASLAQIFDLSTEYIRDRLAACYFHDWQHDPFSHGAYGYVPVEGLDDQRALSQPIDGTLFFAGEATSIGHIGTVHGAIMSGQRAANEILALQSTRERVD
jgi:monoamine oxidase